MTQRPKRWHIALVGVFVLAAAAAAWVWPGRRLRGPATGRDPSSDVTALAPVLLPAPITVAPGVYLLGRLAPAAAYVVETSDGLVLVDSGLETSAAGVLEQLATLHLDVHRLRAILLTHVHADHSLGAERLRALTGASVYAGHGDCTALRAGGPREAFLSVYDMPAVSPHPTTVNEELSGGEKLDFGDVRITVLATPGHTPGSLCYLLERPGLRALFTGDVVEHLNGSQGVPLGTYTTYLPPLYGGNARAFLASLRRLRDLPLPDLILPGHPRDDPVPQNPHLSAERWQGLLDRGIAEMETLLARYAADGANFLDGSPKELLAGLRYLGDCGGSPVYCLSTPKGLFLFDAPGGSALPEFLAGSFQAAGWEGRQLTAVLLTSAGDEATAGLSALIRRYGCAVVAPKAGLETVRRSCPAGTRLLRDDELPVQHWFEVQTIPLEGRGRAPVAYQLPWAGKTVLISGRIPVKLSLPAAEQLVSEVNGPQGSAAGYRMALDRLARVQPAVWLPALPVHGQNANVYDNEWQKVLEQNRQPFP